MARQTGSQRRTKQSNIQSNRTPVIKKGVGGGQGNKKRNSSSSSSSSDSAAKAAWLKKTRNSPAAKAGISDEKRWELQKRKQAFDASRKSKKSSKSTKGSTKTSTNNGVKTKVTSSKGKTTYETSERAKGIAGFFGKKNKKKLTVPNLSNLK